MEPHVCCPQIWISVQPTKTHVKAPCVTFFGCLYDADGVHLDPDKVNAIHSLPAPTNITELQEFLGMVMSFYPWPVHLDFPTVWAAQEGHWLHLELHLWCCLPACQGCCCQWHHPPVLWPFTPCDHPSWCITGRPWCSTASKPQTHGLYQQSPHQCQMPLCQHKKRHVHCCLWSWEI